MFADDTNLFYSNNDIISVFLKVNDELQKINEFLFLTTSQYKKTEHSFFHKTSKKDDNPLALPKLNT